MGIFSRFSDIVNSNINSILEKAEDPEKIVRLMIQEMEDTLVEVRSSAARAIADKKELNRKLAAVERDGEEWQDKAELAIRKERDDLARAALAEKRRMDDSAGALREQYMAVEEGLDKLNEDIGRLEEKLADAKLRQKALITRHQTASHRLEVRKKIHDYKIEDALVRFEGTYPVSSIVDGQFAGFTQGKELLLSFPLAYLVAAFFGLSALAHFLVAYPLRERYEGWLARQFNPMRWAEYALSSTLMIIGIASLSFITDAGALVAIAVCNASMNLFGWSMEEANIGRKNVQWSHYIFGCIAGIAPWIAMFTTVGLSLANWPTGTAPNGGSLEDFKPVLITIYVSLFVSFNIFAVNMVLQRLKVGRWADYLYGERSYMILSLVAKTLLAWQVWTGVFMPTN